jgi:DNA-binding response OmpR family regulator
LNEREPPRLIILDLMLPGMSGSSCAVVCDASRDAAHSDHHAHGESSESDRVTGLDLGADDYITKPFSVRELLARVRAVMRRADETMGKTYEDDHLHIDFDDIRVRCDGRKIKLTNKEFTLLSVLAQKRRSRRHAAAVAG